MSALMLRRRAMGKGGPLVSETFTRADSTTTLGSADTGQAWTATAGVWGVSANKAYVASGTANLSAALDAGRSDVTVEADITLSPLRASPGIGLRMTDASTLLFAQLVRVGDLDKIEFYKRIANTYTLLAQVTAAGLILGTTYRLKAALAGTVHTVSVDGVQRLSFTGATGQEAVTNHGLWMYSDAGNDDLQSRFDNFTVAA